MSPDGSSLAVDADERILVVDTATGARRATIDVGTDEYFFAFSPDSRRLAVSTNAAVSLHEAATGRPVWRNERVGTYNVVGFSPDGRYVWQWELGGNPVFSARDGREVLRVDVEGVDFVEGGRLLVARGTRKVSVWDVTNKFH